MWGRNHAGQLGQGNTTYRSSPVQVGSLTDWGDGERRYKTISMGAGFAAAVKTDGTLWTWGGNSDGQLGIGNTTNKNSPVQVGSLTDWSRIGCNSSGNIALKTDNTLWAWGSNGQGQLGLGDTTNRSSPTQVGSETDWIFAGGIEFRAIRSS